MNNRDVDRLVAEHVMGHEISSGKDSYYKEYAYIINGPVLDDIPKYSTDIAAAWEVVEKISPQILDSKPWTQCFITTIRDGIHCSFKNLYSGEILGDAIETTAPLAICLAALKAKGIEINDV